MDTGVLWALSREHGDPSKLHCISLVSIMCPRAGSCVASAASYCIMLQSVRQLQHRHGIHNAKVNVSWRTQAGNGREGLCWYFILVLCRRTVCNNLPHPFCLWICGITRKCVFAYMYVTYKVEHKVINLEFYETHGSKDALNVKHISLRNPVPYKAIVWIQWWLHDLGSYTRYHTIVI